MHLQRRVVFLVSQMWMFVLHYVRKCINGKRERMLLDCSLHTVKKSRPIKMIFILHKTQRASWSAWVHLMDVRQTNDKLVPNIKQLYCNGQNFHLHEHQLFISFPTMFTLPFYWRKQDISQELTKTGLHFQCSNLMPLACFLLKVEAVHSFITSVNICHTTWHYIPEDGTLQIKSHFINSHSTIFFCAGSSFVLLH